MNRRLKDVSTLTIVSVAVVNETPGSRREIKPEQLGAEMRRMGFGARRDRKGVAPELP